MNSLLPFAKRILTYFLPSWPYLHAIQVKQHNDKTKPILFTNELHQHLVVIMQFGKQSNPAEIPPNHTQTHKHP